MAEDHRTRHESPRERRKSCQSCAKGTASSHQGFPGFVDTYEQEVGEWTVSMESNFVDMDQAPFFKGAPNDQCQANHMGYVLKGRFGVRRGGGVEEIFEAGDAFVIEPGHTPIVFAGSEYVAFTPTDEAKAQNAVIMKFGKEQGIDLPGQPATSDSD